MSDNQKLEEINRDLYNKYNRHHRLTDKTFLFDPTIAPETYFRDMEDISGNCERKYRVSFNNQQYFLEREPQFRWLSDEEYLQEELDKWSKAMEFSYMLEDAGIKNIRKGFHIFVKRSYSSYSQKFRFFVWSLTEYVEGDTILNFDYGAQYPFQYCDTPSYGRHKPGKLVSLRAAKKFCQELLGVYISILKLGYFPRRYNGEGIIINYDGKIEWKFVDHLYAKETDFPNSSEIKTAIENFHSILCWRMCTYTNYSTHKRSPQQHHPFWSKLSHLMMEKSKFYSEMGDNVKRLNDNFPEISMNECIDVFTGFYQYVSSSVD